jgi:hypothetical protein
VNKAAELLSQQNLRLCRYCGELLGPIYGSVKRYRLGAFTTSQIRGMVDDLAADDYTSLYFECYECEAKNRRKRIILSAVLALLLAGAALYRWFA